MEISSFLLRRLTTYTVAGIAILTLLLNGGSVAAGSLPNRVTPPGAHAFGRSYSEWSAAWWKHFIEIPIDTSVCALDGTPYFDSTGACVAQGQSGRVWFVASPLTSLERHYRIPRGTALFVALPVVECSSLEGDPFHGGTEAEQRECANTWGDFIQDVFFELDGVPLSHPEIYRVESPQFAFSAPAENMLFVPGGGPGTSVADGYFVLIAPLSRGVHTLHYGGAFVGTPFGDFSSDITDVVTVK